MKELIDKYLVGETTLDEERELSRYFADEADVAEELQWAKMLFGGFEAAKSETGVVVKRRLGRARVVYSWLSVAAVVAIAATLTLTLKPSETVYCYVNGQPVTELAVAERQAELISRLAGSGERVAIAASETISENVAHSTSGVEKAMKYLNLITN